MSTHSKLNNLVQKSFKSLLNNKNLSDVTFIVCNESLKEKPKEYHCVGAIFASFSSVFEKMLFGSMMESSKDNKVIINDISLIAFDFLQSLFYGLPIKITKENVVHILYAANKYMINDLVRECNEFISNINNINDLIIILKLVNDYKLSDISQQIVSKNHIFNKSSHQIFECDNFKYIPQNLLIELLKYNSLKLKEEKVWQKCLEWSKFQCSVIQINDDNDDDEKLTEHYFMKPLLPHIRYTLMESKFFADHVVTTNLLSKNDTISIFSYMAKANDVKINFNTTQRLVQMFDVYCQQYGHYVNGKQNIFEHKGDSQYRKLLFGSNVKWEPNSGIHSWTIKCWTAGKGNDGIGIISDIEACKSSDIWFHKDTYHPVFWYGDGSVYKMSQVTTLKRIEDGDTIAFELNCDEWSLSIVINGKQDDKHKFIVSGIDPNLSYFPVVNVRGSNNWKYELIQFNIQ